MPTLMRCRTLEYFPIRKDDVASADDWGRRGAAGRDAVAAYSPDNGWPPHADSVPGESTWCCRPVSWSVGA